MKGTVDFRIHHKWDILWQWQSQTTTFRPLMDEIEVPANPPAVVLRRLDDDCLRAASVRKLIKVEIEYAARRVLEALDVLHRKGYVHTDINPSNLRANYNKNVVESTIRNPFTGIQVADVGSTQFGRTQVMLGMEMRSAHHFSGAQRPCSISHGI